LAGWFAACFSADADVAGVEVAGGVAAFEACECVGYVFAVDECGVVDGGEGLDVEWHDTMLPGVGCWVRGDGNFSGDGKWGRKSYRHALLSPVLTCEEEDQNDT
jgi:hypothetical protein